MTQKSKILIMNTSKHLYEWGNVDEGGSEGRLSLITGRSEASTGSDWTTSDSWGRNEKHAGIQF